MLILGAGGHGKVVADTALLLGWRSIAFLDDRAAQIGFVLGLPVIGGFADLPAAARSYPTVALGIGNPEVRREMMRRCSESSLEVATVVHPSAYVSRFATLGPGSVVFAHAVINAGAQLGAGCIVNSGATVDHDCVVGNGVHVCPGAHVAGSVRIGDRAWIGIAASVRQGIRIGQDATIGAGAAVVDDVDDRATVVGVPARNRSKYP
jgi:sugar O-acyltransferase (sialic acid O-acetyltransferase NeuD family)